MGNGREGRSDNHKTMVGDLSRDHLVGLRLQYKHSEDEVCGASYVDGGYILKEEVVRPCVMQRGDGSRRWLNLTQLSSPVVFGASLCSGVFSILICHERDESRTNLKDFRCMPIMCDVCDSICCAQLRW